MPLNNGGIELINPLGIELLNQFIMKEFPLLGINARKYSQAAGY